MSAELLEATLYDDPFPHLIVENFYDDEELKLIWEELDFYTKPDKLLPAKNFGGADSKTNSSGLWLDLIYKNSGDDKPNYRNLSNILTVNRKIFNSSILEIMSSVDLSCRNFDKINYDTTKVRYYHNNEYYKPHTDATVDLLIFSYFHREPKKFTGGELYFPPFEYEFPCNHNSLIAFPGYVEHGVKRVKIENSDYYEGNGRYCISSFAKIVSDESRMNFV
tara:strand:+ start:287 stop:949 length:663 start_codon:yes stop_codon:yes gene_type:complete